MRPETFLEKFDLIADAPGAVAKIRELVLELAVQGKLVPHLEHEEPIPYSSKEGIPINLETAPKNWRIVLLAEAIKNRSGNSKLIKGKLHNESAAGRFQGFSASGADVWCDNYEHEGLAIIISAVGARCGKAFKANGKWSAIANTNIALPDAKLLDFDFAYLFLNNEHFWVRGGSAQPFVKFPPSLNRYYALPPLAEQKRIVAKVDELMALCDRLEQQQNEREAQHAALSRAALTRFSEAPTPENLEYLFHPTYTTTPAELRKTILTLAVQGKLVPQDPNDEPAEELLAKINCERIEAFKERRIGPMKPLPPVEEGEVSYDLRPGRSLARLIELVMEIQTGPFGSSLHQSDYKAGGTPVINPASLKDGKIVPIESMAIGPDTLSRLEVFRLNEGDIVMARRGEMGRCAIVTKANHGWLCGTGSIVLRMPTGMYAPFLAMLIGAPEAREYLGGASVGTTMQNLNQGILAKMPAGVPPLAEQKRIVAKVDELMKLVDRLEAQLTTARTTAENLLNALLADLTSQKAA